ncbi:hypothetical protein ACGFS9_21280 [Streptomyces sp. NPDC048566]|uniref:hypothetical protein n=1 Tax=Streptomyces sp. NPDC048566 TaxID=3365569 RepID=UPI00371C2397
MNGRKAKERRRVQRERDVRLLAAVRAAEPVWERDVPGGCEVWQRGPAVMVAPKVPADAPEELRAAVTVHRAAILALECPGCAGDLRVTGAGSVFLRHEDGCVGSPAHLFELGERLGVEIERRA